MKKRKKLKNVTTIALLFFSSLSQPLFAADMLAAILKTWVEQVHAHSQTEGSIVLNFSTFLSHWIFWMGSWLLAVSDVHTQPELSVCLPNCLQFGGEHNLLDA